VGIIGRNGAGKSTLLKIISPITEPTTGQIRLRGKVASLLGVGTGLHQDLTGLPASSIPVTLPMRRRIEVWSSSTLSLKPAFEIVRASIPLRSPAVDFSGAFSLHSLLILIIDEVLVVGDAQFQKNAWLRADKLQSF
jgi:homopolymeric O-antigen transport system ATP-binding protein